MECRRIPFGDRPAFDALAGPYLAEIAPGLTAEPEDFDRYWTDPDRHAYGLYAPDLQGFAMIRRLDDGSHELTEFNIAPSYRRRGTGSAFARSVLTRHPGRWRLGIAGAGPARDFWAKCLAACAEVSEIDPGPPFTPHQTASLHFTVRDPEHDPS